MIAGLVVGLLVGCALGLLVGLLQHAGRRGELKAQFRGSEARLAEAQTMIGSLNVQLQEASAQAASAQAEAAQLTVGVEHERRAAEERAAAWERDRAQLSGTFAELSVQALQQNTEQFLTLADSRLREAHQAAGDDLTRRQEAISQLLQPLHETLAKYERGLRQLELDRQGAYVGLTEQVKHLATAQDHLQRETRNLVSALRSPQTRGRWGELQLRRVVEVAGMVAHCDFDEQVTVTSDDGRLRPDLVVHLAGGAQVVVDAKVPLDAFLRAIDHEDDEEVRRTQLVAHARQLRTHVDQLAKREYWAQFDPSPEFVVAFVPGDSLLASAYEHDPTLVEHAMVNRVLLATPTTLIALLRTVALGWQREQLAANAVQVQQHGAELYERLRVMGGHLSKLHRSLTGTVEAFNDTVGSLEARVLVTARRFPELGVVGHDTKELPELRPVVASPRAPAAPDLLSAEGAASPDPDEEATVSSGFEPYLLGSPARDELPAAGQRG